MNTKKEYSPMRTTLIMAAVLVILTASYFLIANSRYGTLTVAGQAKESTLGDAEANTPSEEKEDPLKESATQSTSKTTKIINTLKNKTGSDYVWGAEGSSTFDCSGLVYWAFQVKHGVTLASSRVTADSYARAGKHVEWGHLKKGDLLFFNKNKDGKIEHIGVYLGKMKFIHASMSYDKVLISHFDDHTANPDTGVEDSTKKTYRQLYVGARRVINNDKKTSEANLKLGSKGKAVKGLQKDLKYLGYNPGSTDGSFGKKTKKAVIKFQKDYGLDQDGIVGPKTREMIREVKSYKKWQNSPSTEYLA